MSSFKDLFESPVGMVGRTGVIDAKAHVTAELRAEFKRLVKSLGGKTVARQLLAEMNAGGPITEADKVLELYKSLKKEIQKLPKSDAREQALQNLKRTIEYIDDATSSPTK